MFDWNAVFDWNVVIGWVVRFNKAGGSCFDINRCNLCVSELGEVRLGFKVCKVSLGLGQDMVRVGEA